MDDLVDHIYHIDLEIKNNTDTARSALYLEEFEDTKAVIRIRISKKNRQNNGKKRYKRTNNDLQNIHIKLKIE
jgi:tRNA A-37 threonylcarbamoyl transferase component Bud32